MKKSTKDISRLPRWAQFLIQKLQADVADYKPVAHKVQTGKSRVCVGGGPLREPRFLPDNEAFAFKLANGHSVSVRLVEGGLSLNCNEGMLAVIPIANNSVLVKSVDSRFNWED